MRSFLQPLELQHLLHCDQSKATWLTSLQCRWDFTA